ncbi:MAG TPA: hypothetical protein VN947_32900 [Polyangia bacterium]|nr:hypothetical protein [Polyangia bacterium]
MTNVHEIADNIYRISTPVPPSVMPGGFTFNQFLVVSMQDLADRPPLALADGAELALGKKRVRWLDAPHLPHNWECGYLFEPTTATLLCGDLFTHGGDDVAPLTESDALGPSEAMRLANPASAALGALPSAADVAWRRNDTATLARALLPAPNDRFAIARDEALSARPRW